MKRNKDVSRLHPAEMPESVETGTRPCGCAAAVELATALLERAMRESEEPVAELSAAVARMAQLKVITAGAMRDALARDVAVCIENLQFHDRLMQQLTQVREALTGLAANRLPAQAPAIAAGESSIELF
jgi:hypothetical protein